VKKIIFISLVLTHCVLSQRIEKTLNGEYYGAYGLPTRIGDAWNYWNYRDYYFRPEFKIELIDTVRINGEQYFLQRFTDRVGYSRSTVHIRLRDDGFYVALDSALGPLRNKQDYIYYKKNAQVGDFWVQRRNVPIERFIYHKIIANSAFFSFWGTWIRTKVVDVTDSVLTHYRENWSEEFGMVELPYWLLLRGYVINGTKYGDTTLVSVEDQALINPTDFNLFQNYPNPFNAVTIIQYKVPITSFVKLKVYDMLGKEIAVLVSEEKPPGNYFVDFNAEGLPSGIYFYRITTDNFSATNKMLYLK
jgi:hypothetical protein